MTAKRESDLLITSMITDRIGRHDVLLPINQKYDKIWEMNKPSIDRWTTKHRYECWKTRQFTQQSALQERMQNDTYCPITSMTRTLSNQCSNRAADSQSRSRILL